MKEKRKNRKVILFSVSLVGALLLVAGTTFAWFASSDIAHNRLNGKQHEFDVPVHDEFEARDSFLSGETAAKRVSASNRGDTPAFARLLVFPSLIGEDGTVYPVQIGDGGFIEIDMNETDWFHGDDGYYYYLGQLAPGETAPLLFEEVGLSDNLPAEYVGATLRIDIKAETVEAVKWVYRESWWNSEAPLESTEGLAPVDAVLAETLQ